MNRLINFAAGLIVIGIISYFLIVGSSIFIPLIIAIFIWNLFNTLVVTIQRIPIFNTVPNGICIFLALVIFTILISMFIYIITHNVNAVIAASSRYQDKLLAIVNNVDQNYHIKILAGLQSFIKTLNVQTLFINIYQVFTTIAGSAMLIALYVAFLFVEQYFFRKKMAALFPLLENRQLMDNILTHLVMDTQVYLGLKTLLSLVAAGTSWIIMMAIGLDFAEFWALIMFFLNFIPGVGAIIAIIFPILLALIQFSNWLPFIELSLGLIIVQFIVGNIIEPRFFSKSLNLSPLVILLSLTLWGAIWGILGMFLAVPITVMIMIIFAHFECTRPIAILLSQDGNIFQSYKVITVENTPEKDWNLY